MELEVIETQERIIRLQSEAIAELSRLLLQHISSEELDALPASEKINTAAELRSVVC